MSLRPKTVKVSELVPDPQNVRKHNAANLESIKNSLQAFGQRRALICAKANDGRLVVIAGNGTLEAAKALGWERIDVTVVPDDWDADKARAYAIADNRSAELAEWDEGLAEALLELDAVGWEPAVLGFELETVPAGAGDVVEDEAPEPPAEPVTKPGDLWLLGDHRVLCGDSTKPEDVERLMDGRKADCVWTDPPYGVAYVGKTADALTIQNDKLDEGQLFDFLDASLGNVIEVCTAGAAVYTAAPAGPLLDVFAQVLRKLGVRRHTLVWVKDQFVLGHSDYHYRHETLFYGWKPGKRHEPPTRDQDSVFEVPRPKRSSEHPTMKPVELVARCIANSTDPGDIVAEPFGGSGSTLIAAEQLGRTCYAIELDPVYVDVIVNRWEALTGKKAIRAEG